MALNLTIKTILDTSQIQTGFNEIQKNNEVKIKPILEQDKFNFPEQDVNVKPNVEKIPEFEDQTIKVKTEVEKPNFNFQDEEVKLKISGIEQFKTDFQDAIGTAKGQFSDLFANMKSGNAGGAGQLFESLTGIVTQFAAKLGPVGALATAAGAGIAKMYSEGRELSNAFKDMQNATGATGVEFEKLKDTAAQMFQGGIGESVAEASKTLVLAKSQLKDFLNTDELGNFILKANALGSNFDMDVNEVVSKSSQFIKIFGLNGKEAMDLIAYGMKNANTQAADVLDTLAEYSPLMRDAGFNAKEFIGILNKGVQEGAFNTDFIADGIKEFNIRLKDASGLQGFKDASTQIETGLRSQLVTILDIGTKGLVSTKNTMKDFAATLKAAVEQGKISVNEAQALAVTVAGTKVEDLGFQNWSVTMSANIDEEQIMSESEKAGKLIENQIGQYDTFSSLYKSFQTNFQMISEQFVTFFDTYIMPFVDTLLGLFEGIWNSLKEGFSAVFSGIGDLISSIIKAFTDLFGITKEGEKSTLSFAGVIAVLVGALKQWYDILSTIINVAIKVLIVSFKAIIGVLKIAISFVKGILSAFFDLLKLIPGVSSVIDFLKNVINNVINAFKGAGNAITTFKATVSGVYNVIIETINIITDLADALFSLDFSKLADIWNDAGKRTKDAFDKGWNDIKKSEKEKEALEKMKKDAQKFVDDINDSLDTIGKSKGTNKEKTAQILELQNQLNEFRKAGALTEDVYNQTLQTIKQRIDAINKEPVKLPPDAKTVANAKDLLATLQGIRDTLMDSYEVDLRLKAATESRAVTAAEELSILQNNLNLQKDLAKNYVEQEQELKKIAVINSDGLIEFIPDVKEADKKKFEEKVFNINKDIKEKTTGVLNFQLDITTDIEKNIKEADKILKDYQEEIDKKRLTANLELAITNDNTTEIEKAQNELKTFYETKKKLLVDENAVLEKQYDANSKIQNIDSETAAKQVETANLIVANKKKIQEYDDALGESVSKLGAEVDKTNDKISETKSVIDTLAESLSESFKLNIDTSDVDKINSDFDTAAEELRNQLSGQLINYGDYIQKIKELENDKNEKLNNSESLRKALYQSTSDFLFKLSDTEKGIFADTFNDIKTKNEELRKQLEENTITLSKFSKETLKNITENYKEIIATFAIQTGAIYAQMIAQGKSANEALWDSIIVSTISMVEQLLAIYAPEIIAGFMAVLSPIPGAIAGAAAVAGLYSMLEAAKINAGAESGYMQGVQEGTKGKDDTKLIWINPQEVIIPVQTAQRNKLALQEMLKYGEIRSAEAVNQSLSGNGDLTKYLKSMDNRLANLENQQNFRNINVKTQTEIKPTKFVVAGNDLVSVIDSYNKFQQKMVR